MKRVLVVGGGITGLTLARRLAAMNHQVTLVEQSHRFGGWMRSNRQDGFTFEHGPNSLRVSGGADTIHLVNQLGIGDQVVMPSKDSRKRFVMHRGLMAPAGLAAVGMPSFWIPIMRGLLTEWSHSPLPDSVEDESIYDFMARRLNTKVADTVADAMVTGVFAGDPRQLSMRSCFAAIWRAEREHGSLTRWNWDTRNDAPEVWPPTSLPGESPWLATIQQTETNTLGRRDMKNSTHTLKPPTLLSPQMFRNSGAPQYTFRTGIDTLPHALEHQLRSNPRVRLLPSVTVASMTPMPAATTTGGGTTSGGMEVKLVRRHGAVLVAGAQQRTFDHVYVTTGANAFANILDNHHRHHIDESNPSGAPPQPLPSPPSPALTSLIHDLRSLPYTSVWTVAMGWRQSDLLAPSRRAFGVLAPHGEKKPWLGVIFNSAVFPDQAQSSVGDTRITVMIGGARRPDLVSASRAEIENIAASAARDIGISGDADIMKSHLAHQCIPQYPVGYHATRDIIKHNVKVWSHGRCHVMGPVTANGVSINQCISQAMTAPLV